MSSKFVKNPEDPREAARTYVELLRKKQLKGEVYYIGRVNPRHGYVDAFITILDNEEDNFIHAFRCEEELQRKFPSAYFDFRVSNPKRYPEHYRRRLLETGWELYRIK